MRCQTKGDAFKIPRENQNYSLVISLIMFEDKVKFILDVQERKIIMQKNKSK